MSDARPILFFDSGVGGLSIVAPARAALPEARFIYVADSAGFPYGTKSEAEIAARVPALRSACVRRRRTSVIPLLQSATNPPSIGTHSASFPSG